MRARSRPGRHGARTLPPHRRRHRDHRRRRRSRHPRPMRSRRSSSASTPTGRIRASARIPASAFRSPSRSSKRTAAHLGGEPHRRADADGERRCSAPASSSACRRMTVRGDVDAHRPRLSASPRRRRGVLIRGPSGSGKSRLALELIRLRRRGRLPFARLVADDRVHLLEAAWPAADRAPAPELAADRGPGARHPPAALRAGRRCRPCGRSRAARRGAAAARHRTCGRIEGVPLPRLAGRHRALTPCRWCLPRSCDARPDATCRVASLNCAERLRNHIEPSHLIKAPSRRCLGRITYATLPETNRPCAREFGWSRWRPFRAVHHEAPARSL